MFIYVYLATFMSVQRFTFGYNEEYIQSTLNTCAASCGSETLPFLIQCAVRCSQTSSCDGVSFNPEDDTCCTCSTLGVPGQAFNPETVLYRKTEVPLCNQDLVNYIPDYQMTASSTYLPINSHHPSRARLNMAYDQANLLGGAWSAGTKSTDSLYIQAMFNKVKVVVGIATQGRNTMLPMQCVTVYRFSYSIDCVTFFYIKDDDGFATLFPGNNDRDSIVWNDLLDSVLAVCVRIHPVTFITHPSLRFGIKGCDI